MRKNIKSTYKRDKKKQNKVQDTIIQLTGLVRFVTKIQNYDVYRITILKSQMVLICGVTC